jgi:hypothetical protein
MVVYRSAFSLTALIAFLVAIASFGFWSMVAAVLGFLVWHIASADIAKQSVPSMYVIGMLVYQLRYIIDQFDKSLWGMEAAILGFAECVRTYNTKNAFFIIGLFLQQSGVHGACVCRNIADIDTDGRLQLDSWQDSFEVQLQMQNGRANPAVIQRPSVLLLSKNVISIKFRKDKYNNDLSYFEIRAFRERTIKDFLMFCLDFAEAEEDARQALLATIRPRSGAYRLQDKVA